MTDPPLSSLPFEIVWPNAWTIILLTIRTLLTALSIESTRIFGKKVIYRLLCKIKSLDFKDTQSMRLPSVEVPLKLMIYSSIGINVAFTLPILFRYLGI